VGRSCEALGVDVVKGLTKIGWKAASVIAVFEVYDTEEQALAA